MPTIQQFQTVDFTPEQMFALADDFKSYSEFLPWLSGSRELERTDDWVRGELSIAAGGFSQSFVTKNLLEPPHKMVMTLESGPFSHLRGEWLFEAVEGGCKVSLDLEFEFKSKLMAVAANKMLTKAANEMVAAFVARARAIY